MNLNDPMLEVYIYESEQLLEQLEEILLTGEKVMSLTSAQIDEIFRIMHTIKGSSAMMSFDSLAKLSHAVEDMFSQIREKKARSADWENLFDIVLAAADFLKAEVAKITSGQEPNGEAGEIISKIDVYLELLTHRKTPPPEEEKIEEPLPEQDYDPQIPASYYYANLFFQKDCKMENIRAFGVANALLPFCIKQAHIPEDLLEEECSDEIISNGLKLFMYSSSDDELLRQTITETMFLDKYEFAVLDENDPKIPESIRVKPEIEEVEEVEEIPKAAEPEPKAADSAVKQSYISVNVSKLDKLMDLVGEIVTTESMVTKNPDLNNLQLDNFEKSAQMLRKLTDELQDIVMSIRMVPVSSTFHKMQRIVRDMSKKVHKDVELIIIGEETELDKNIIDNLSDPLMHLIRNSMDHGLESAEERDAAGKSPVGRITLEARNTGGDVMIIVSDDGRGLNRQKLIEKAIANGITAKTEAEISDKEAYAFIFAAGFSTKEQVTEFSGRGVGMDVVRKNIENIGGTLSIESELGKGMALTIRIPLTLAIMDGMMVKVGSSNFIMPMLAIRESFKPKAGEVFMDPANNEMIMIRGDCYPVLRLNRIFSMNDGLDDVSEGILMLVETETATVCLLVDSIVGEQQVVIKPLPNYISRNIGDTYGMGGCTILGDGSISLILDTNNLVSSLLA